MYPEALEEFNQAISLRDDFEPAYTSIEFVYELMGKMPEAIEAYKKSVALNPNNVEIMQHLGQLFIQQTRWLMH